MKLQDFPKPAERETLESDLRAEIATLKLQLLDKDIQIERLQMDLDLADLTIDRYSRGLM